MKKAIYFAVMILAVSACAVSRSRAAALAEEGTNWYSMQTYLSGMGLSQETLDDIKDVVEERTNPVLKDISIDPASPGAGEEVMVSATLATPPGMGGDEVETAYVNYSVDGGATMRRVEMTRDESNERLWRGIIPGQPSGSRVIYGVQAINVYDEAYVEAICPATSVPEVEPVDDGGCASDKSPDYCKALKPAGCMFPTSALSSKFDIYSEAPGDLLDDLNIMFARVGFDENDVHIKMAMKGKVSPGQFSPMDVHIYVAGWLNPDRSGGEQGINAILKQGAVALYAPLNPTNKCALYNLNIGTTLQSDTASVKCDVVDKSLNLTVKRNSIGPNPSGTLEFVFMTFTLWGLSPPVVKLDDLSLFTRVVFVNRGYSVL